MKGWTRSPILPCSSLPCRPGEVQRSVLWSAAASKGRASSAALSSQPSVVTGVMDFYTHSSGSRATGPDVARGSSSGLDITMATGSERATHLSLLLTAFTSSDLPLSTGHQPFCLALSLPYPTIYLFTIQACDFSSLPGAICLRHTGSSAPS